MPLVSIIVPVYNTEKYLPKCLNSLLAQTLQDIEVLLIDDGSTDSSGMICDNYTHQDKRLQVLHIPNQGVSHARNKGLEIAKGEYVLFVDSDDWIETDMVNTLYQLVQNYQTDLSTCGYIIEDEDGHTLYKVEEQTSCKLEKWDAIHSLFHDRYYKYKGNLWDKLYNKRLIDRNNLKFNENISYNEDRLFIFQYLSYCQSISYTTLPYYHNIIRKASAMNSFEKNAYNEKMTTFMDAFDIMTQLSINFPCSINYCLSVDYIKSSFLFFTKHAHQIPIQSFKNRFYKIKKYNYPYLPFSEKLLFSLHYFKILLRINIYYLIKKL